MVSFNRVYYFVENTPYTLWIGGALIVGASSYIAWRERN